MRQTKDDSALSILLTANSEEESQTRLEFGDFTHGGVEREKFTFQLHHFHVREYVSAFKEQTLALVSQQTAFYLSRRQTSGYTSILSSGQMFRGVPISNRCRSQIALLFRVVLLEPVGKYLLWFLLADCWKFSAEFSTDDWKDDKQFWCLWRSMAINCSINSPIFCARLSAKE